MVVEAVDGCLICERVRVERSRQEENKTHRGSRAEQSSAKQCQACRRQAESGSPGFRNATSPIRRKEAQRERATEVPSAGGSRAEPNRAELSRISGAASVRPSGRVVKGAKWERDSACV